MIRYMLFISIITLLLADGVLLGDYILERFKIKDSSKLVKLPFGLIAIYAIFQLLFYPFALFHCSTVFLGILLMAIIVLIPIILHKNIKKCILNINKIYLLLVVLAVIVVCILLFMKPYSIGYDYYIGDAFYYIGLVQENAISSNYINLCEPTTGWYGVNYNDYAFRSAYHLLSAISILSGVKAIVVSIWGGTILTVSIVAATIINIFYVLPIKEINLKFVYVICLMGIVLSPDYLPYLFFPSNINVILNILILLLLFMFYKNNKANQNYLYLYLILLSGSLSFQSTQFMVYVVFSFAVTGYEIFVNKNYDIHYFTFISCPLLLYACVYLVGLYGILFVLCFILCIASVNLIYHYKSTVFNYKLLMTIAILLLMLEVIYSRSHSSITYDFPIVEFSVNGIKNLLIYSFPIVVFFRRNKTANEYKLIATTTVIIFLYFLNPLVQPFTVRFISGAVIHRISSVFVPVIYVWLIVDYYINIIGDKIFKKFLSFIFIITFTIEAATYMLNNINDLYLDIINRTEYFEDVNPIYKLGKNSEELALFFDEYIKEDGTRWIVSIPILISNLKISTDNVVLSNTGLTLGDYRKFNWDDISSNNSDCLLAMYLQTPETYFTDWLFINESKTPPIKDVLMDSNAEMFIISKWKAKNEENTILEQLLNTFSFKVYENDEYEVYQIYK